MRIGVQGHRYGRVSKELLDEFRMDPTAKKQRGAGVSEVVEADLWQSGPFEEWLERAFDHILGVDESSNPRSEDQAMIFVEIGASHLLL